MNIIGYFSAAEKAAIDAAKEILVDLYGDPASGIPYDAVEGESREAAWAKIAATVDADIDSTGVDCTAFNGEGGVWVTLVIGNTTETWNIRG